MSAPETGVEPETEPMSTSGPLSIGATRTTLRPDDPVAAAWQALRGVYDPELCIDVVSLGLVYDVRDQDGTVVVDMTLTTPGCPASESLPEMAKLSIEDAVATAPVEVHVVWDPPWDPSMMADDASESLGFRAG